MSDYPSSVDEIINLTDKPVVAADQTGVFTFVNQKFTDTYGWTQEDLSGKLISAIMPEELRSGHHIGFARFLATEQARIAGKPLDLKVLFKDGTVKEAVHFILADKKNGHWQFAAIIELKKD